MRRSFIFILLALLCAANVHADTLAPEDTLARAATENWRLSIEGEDLYTDEDCTLNLIARGTQGRHEISLREKFVGCSFFGPVKIVADEGARGTLVFVQGARGGDGDHTGPVVAAYRLTAKGFKKLGQQELFDARYLRRAGHITSVSGKVLFSFCLVCDGPDAGPEADHIFVPATLRVGCGGICVKPAVSARQRAALIARFEHRRDELAKGPSSGDDDGTGVRKLAHQFREFMARKSTGKGR